MTTNDIRTELNKAKDELLTLRDEARVRLHLAGMEAKQAWDKLEPSIDEAEKLATDASHKALESIQATTKKLREIVSSF